jgi:hypothetical protein
MWARVGESGVAGAMLVVLMVSIGAAKLILG